MGKTAPLTKSQQMARVRSKNTAIELIFRKKLWAAGFRYRIHPRLPGKPDIVFARKKVVIFIDGCFWHGCPLHYTQPIKNAEFWKDKIGKNLSRDEFVSIQLRELGWTVFRFWEHEIETNLDDCLKRIITVLSK